MKWVWVLVVGLALSGCSALEGSVSHRLEMVIPASVPSIEEGKLVASLLAYDPSIADKLADELDVEEITFSHTQGTRTMKSVTLQAVRPAGFDTYVSAEGCERISGEWVYVLWDGQEGIGMPRSVQMRSVGPDIEAYCD